MNIFSLSGDETPCQLENELGCETGSEDWRFEKWGLHPDIRSTPQERWRWKSNILARGYIFRCFIFHCHISLRGCICSMFSGYQEYPYSSFLLVFRWTHMWHGEGQLYRSYFLEMILSHFFWLENCPVFDCMIIEKMVGCLMKQFSTPSRCIIQMNLKSMIFLGKLLVGHPKRWYI